MMMMIDLFQTGVFTSSHPRIRVDSIDLWLGQTWKYPLAMEILDRTSLIIWRSATLFPLAGVLDFCCCFTRDN